MIYFLTAKNAEQAQRTQRADAFTMKALSVDLGCCLAYRLSTNQQINRSTDQQIYLSTSMMFYFLTAKNAEQAQRTQRADAFTMKASDVCF